jgi:hypothetical protein
MRTLLQVSQHDDGRSAEARSTEVRVARALAAVATMPAKRNPASAYWELISYGAADLALDLEPRIPPDLRAQAYTWRHVRELVTRLYPDRVPQDLRLRAAAWAATVLAADPKVDCTSLADQIKLIAFNPAALPALDARTCSCLTGELRNEVHLVNRDDLLQHAKSRKLACIKGLPAETD